MACTQAMLPCVVKREKVPGEAARCPAQSATAKPSDTGDKPPVNDAMLIRMLWSRAAAASMAELGWAVLSKKDRTSPRRLRPLAEIRSTALFLGVNACRPFSWRISGIDVMAFHSQDLYMDVPV
jgi:hypothetical protein